MTKLKTGNKTIWILMIGIYLVIGAWKLVLPLKGAI